MTTTLPAAAKRFAAAALLLAVAACGPTPEPPRPVTPPAPSTAAPTTPAPYVPVEQATFAFEPFIGAPGNVADDLSRQIGTRARDEGLTLVRRADLRATFRVKGYLSASGSPASSAVFYVFDVFDAHGLRVTRLSGSELTQGVSGDPWRSADADTLKRIAATSVMQLKAWLLSRPAPAGAAATGQAPRPRAG
ncbi:hypothetical protein GWI72_01335 [Microvirga tunisiensis]|uniref:Uncharacterized protein n=2 Tax=Pannonibacter tanglangensis TaxID=2750084 RepID=A0ABW9ZEY5_9HYPH|nr:MULTISPECIES: hypothetical protein [unclassified Pannonibacter]NBN63266.1 hypothetical protein [Pannonibacter sp. XCT-34]NBN76905.1 hypothetical protein [Pannonibacter sp. XCT-53]